MKRKEKLRRNFYATTFMLFGTCLVMGTIVLINDEQDNLDAVNGADTTDIKFERKKPKTEQQVRKPKPKPKPKKSRPAPPAPLLGLNSQLAGLDLGLPEFSLDGLNGLDSDILGGGDGVVMTDDTVDQSPRAIQQSPMMYPPRARAKGIEGYVVFSLLIGITGEIEQIKIVESVPEGVFDDVAMQGVNSWKFEPAQYQGKSVKAWARQRVRFDLS